MEYTELTKMFLRNLILPVCCCFYLFARIISKQRESSFGSWTEIVLPCMPIFGCLYICIMLFLVWFGLPYVDIPESIQKILLTQLQSSWGFEENLRINKFKP